MPALSPTSSLQSPSPGRFEIAARQAAARSAASGLRPPPRLPLSQWQERHRVLPSEASGMPGKWSNAKFPFLVEIADCLNPWHPSETVTFMKSAQVGGTETGLNWIFAIADMWPGPSLMVHPTVAAGLAWNREKLVPSLRVTGRVRAIMVPQLSRDGGSTSLHKSFPGGFLVITGSNSAADISSKTIRYVIKEEWDRWTHDVDGQGDPDELVNARQISYHRRGLAKTFQPSTPVDEGDSRVAAAYEAGDQRRYHVPCPECGHAQILRFFPLHQDGRGGLRFNREAPHQAVYVCEANGCAIEHHRKDEMLAGGRWIAGAPGPGRQPSFHINALYSPVTTWDKVAEAYVRAKDDHRRYKAFVNLWLGEPFKEITDAPDADLLMIRRIDFPKRTLPPGALLIFGAVDVQKDRLEFGVYAYGAGLTCWLIDRGVLEGDPTTPAVWRQLDAVRARRYEDQAGRTWGADAFAIDTGYLTTHVYRYVGARVEEARAGRLFAVKGVDGWREAPLGVPTSRDVDFEGRKKGEVRVFSVGTWDLKSEIYAALRKTIAGPLEETGAYPVGTMYFPEALADKEFFKQLTAETLGPSKKNPRFLEWQLRGDQANEALDVAVYVRALMRHFTDELTPEQWARLAAARNVAVERVQRDLAEYWSPPAAGAAPGPETSTPANAVRQQGGREVVDPTQSGPLRPGRKLT